MKVSQWAFQFHRNTVLVSPNPHPFQKLAFRFDLPCILLFKIKTFIHFKDNFFIRFFFFCPLNSRKSFHRPYSTKSPCSRTTNFWPRILFHHCNELIYSVFISIMTKSNNSRSEERRVENE